MTVNIRRLVLQQLTRAIPYLHYAAIGIIPILACTHCAATSAVREAPEYRYDPELRGIVKIPEDRRSDTKPYSYSGALVRDVWRRKVTSPREYELINRADRDAGEGPFLCLLSFIEWLPVTCWHAPFQVIRKYVVDGRMRRNFQHGKELQEERRWEEAAIAYLTALRITPEFGINSDILIRLGECYEELGMVADARQAYLDFIAVAGRAWPEENISGSTPALAARFGEADQRLKALGPHEESIHETK